MKIKYHGITDKGAVRDANEDSILCGEVLVNSNNHYEMTEIIETDVSIQPIWFAIADGMGGHDSGEIASRITLEKLLNSFKTKGTVYLNDPTMLIELIKQIHKDVNEYGTGSGKQSMGTTLVGMLFNQEKFYLYNVGDSRIYLLRDGYLQQKTRDHSLKEQIGINVAKNFIISSIGGGKDDIIIDLYDLSDQIKDNDLFVISSDGLTDFNYEDSYDEFETLINDSKDKLDQLDRSLIRYAINKGSKDNISIISIFIENTTV